MSENKNDLSSGFLLRSKAIRILGNRVQEVGDLRTAGKVSWHLYGGLYKLMYRMGETETIDNLGWAPQKAASMLMQAYVVAAVEPTTDVFAPRAFTNLMMPLTERLDNEKSTVGNVQQLNAHMIDGYIAIADSAAAREFIISKGVEDAMHESLKAAGRDARSLSSL